VLEHPGTARRMGEQGQRSATGRFAWSHVAGQLAAYYRELRGEREPVTVPAPVEQRESAGAPG
jgi:hypothetical protein